MKTREGRGTKEEKDEDEEEGKEERETGGKPSLVTYSTLLYKPFSHF